MATFTLQIVTPDGESFNGPAERLIARAIDGDVCILANHSKYVTALSTGEVRVTIDGTRRRAACSGGMLSAIDNAVRLVANTFEWAEEIDATRAQLAKEAAERTLQDATDAHEISLAKGKLAKALVRINVAK